MPANASSVMATEACTAARTLIAQRLMIVRYERTAMAVLKKN